MSLQTEQHHSNDVPPKWWEVGVAIVGFVVIGLVLGMLTYGLCLLCGVSDMWIFYVSVVFWIAVVWIRCMFL